MLAGELAARGADTVGAVALDATGALAAATSTGGPPGKRVGRVGDSAIPGAGLCVEAGRACSSTGIGEAILRVGLARRVCSAGPLAETMRSAVADLATVDGEGGCIVVSRDGEVRVAGREYNGLAESACFQRGEMSCFSCHQLHPVADDPASLARWRDDQLAPGATEPNATRRRIP